ncbi:hypothetical protein M2409_005399 [Sphingobacterium sp. JUb21]|nr:hypothetical protein [Sphingobacterium sp. JUb21]
MARETQKLAMSFWLRQTRAARSIFNMSFATLPN